MNRIEALRLLGLDEDATDDDIRVAYREVAQILHPDRFAANTKLQDRATEQFKNLQEAYDYLQKNAGKGTGGSVSAHSGGAYRNRKAQELEARLAGISAARVQIVAQRDLLADERRNNLIIIAVGLVVGVVIRWRMPFLLAIASAAVVWGIVRAAAAQMNLSKIDEHLSRLKEEKQLILKELEEQDL